MASGRKHWRLRLGRLAGADGPISRADRRQLRKLLGRAWGLEWRSFGNARRGVWGDALNREILDASRAGHVAKRLRDGGGS